MERVNPEMKKSTINLLFFMPKKSDSLDFCGHNLQLTIFTSVCCEFGVYKKSLLVGQKIASEDRLAQGKA